MAKWRNALQLICTIRELAEEIDSSVNSSDDVEKLQNYANPSVLALAVSELRGIIKEALAK